MPSQVLYELMSYGSMALVVAAMVVGIVLTNGAVRTLLAAALALEVVRFLANLTVPAFIYSSGDAAVFVWSFVQMVMSVGSALLLVAAAVVGARKVAAKDATIAALVDKPKDTWTQPETSPDPRLLAD
jgi:hypothetical protein